ncbi:hypothetical protein PAT3040_02550 [Paenibacillus agaridevorans]|uniref:Uncharacterized protein n=1 Tax=Paenibacillus agaridevorans TaxID=171404 RepID=A0A2R5EPG2_9BACL|nr:hypothetical protein [Paenibacillus agaridevorans]GBG07985.1 hypothetical protein PAT3040_02550 [Paenibacillus agaridevorans]
MKLIGSKLEQEIREQLSISNQSLFESEEKRRLLEVIKSSFPEMRTAYIVNWIPEQGEDIYKILINDSIIADIELDRYSDDFEPIVESKDIPNYLHGLSKQNQIKLAVALDLAKQELKNME